MYAASTIQNWTLDCASSYSYLEEKSYSDILNILNLNNARIEELSWKKIYSDRLDEIPSKVVFSLDYFSLANRKIKIHF